MLDPQAGSGLVENFQAMMSDESMSHESCEFFFSVLYQLTPITLIVKVSLWGVHLKIEQS